jgi:twitching motility protein PilT
MDLNQILAEAASKEASDVHLKEGVPPIFRVNGVLTSWNKMEPFDQNDISKMAFGLMNDWQKERFIKARELDMGYEVVGLGRFRVNIFQQRGKIRIALRIVPYKIRSLEELYLPPVIRNVALEERGLILVTGTTGSGKSTTLASMINIINETRNCHVITIEDPIETAVTASETGHLVMSTLHTLNAVETINRIISIFPPYHQKQVRLQLSAVLKGVISQRLVPRADGTGRVPAVEVLVSTARVRECIIEKDKTQEINDAMSRGVTTYGMQSFDQSLMSLLNQSLITYEEALRHCTNPDDFSLRVKGILATSDTTWDNFEVADKEKEKEEKKEEKGWKFGKPLNSKIREGGPGFK